ncbi:hypothetical protein ACQPYK_23470 [Streptosporangium sp. CA-135522]|uniref:hypothetical protein n=1 Tax=Streptosporangium sp. CA-135522 TaxID=3240072 RepID=UPI003D8C341B
MRVVIVEDNVLLSSGLELLLAAKGCEVVAVVGDGEAFLDAVAEHRPDNAVHKHIGNIFVKLGLAPDDSGHRRVRAVLTYLDGTPRPAEPDPGRGNPH